jgi:hypothetical protein
MSAVETVSAATEGLSPPTTAPLRREAGEREGPIAQQWEGEVVESLDAIFPLQAPWPTSPSPRFARVPSLSPHEDVGGEGLSREES